MVKTLDVVTLGEAMVSLAAEQVGPLRHAVTFRRSSGGAEFNVAVGLARLGLRSGWVSRLGDDEFGHYLLECLRANRVDCSRVRLTTEAPTGVYFKEWRTHDTMRVHYYRRGSAATRMEPSDLDQEYLSAARWLHVTGITPALGPGPRATVLHALEAARALQVPASLDPNYRSRLWGEAEAAAVLRTMAQQVAVLLPSVDEARLLVGPGQPPDLAARLVELGPEVVIVKAGAEGAYYATRSGQAGWVPQFRTTVVDPVGAGDAFAAGFLTGWLEQQPLVESIRLGHAAGAFVVSVPGDTDGMPWRAEAERFMQEQGTDIER